MIPKATMHNSTARNELRKCAPRCQAANSSGSSGRGPKPKETFPGEVQPNLRKPRRHRSIEIFSHAKEMQKKVRTTGSAIFEWRAHANHKVRGMTTKNAIKNSRAVPDFTNPSTTLLNLRLVWSLIFNHSFILGSPDSSCSLFRL